MPLWPLALKQQVSFSVGYLKLKSIFPLGQEKTLYTSLVTGWPTNGCLLVKTTTYSNVSLKNIFRSSLEMAAQFGYSLHSEIWWNSLAGAAVPEQLG